MTKEEFIRAFKQFSKDREWDQWHSPKNLAMSMGSEVGELLDLFRWMTEEQSYHPDKFEAIREEIGDVYIVLHQLADKLGIDPLEAAKDKLVKMETRYPVEIFKGSCKKYSDV